VHNRRDDMQRGNYVGGSNHGSRGRGKTTPSLRGGSDGHDAPVRQRAACEYPQAQGAYLGSSHAVFLGGADVRILESWETRSSGCSLGSTPAGRSRMAVCDSTSASGVTTENRGDPTRNSPPSRRGAVGPSDLIYAQRSVWGSKPQRRVHCASAINPGCPPVK
jgi:hypothetical protein